MQLKHYLSAGAFALAALAAAPSAEAAPCAGFTDVDDTSPFCANVEWVKNRGITLGCGAGTTYCPNDGVTRLQMAVFMNRLGNTLSPVFVRKRQTGGELGALNFAGGQTVCATDPAGGIAITGYPRTAILTALLNVFTPDDGFELLAQLVYSINGGPFTALPTGDGFAFGSLYKNAPGTANAFTPPFDVSLRPYAFVDLQPGNTYRFAVQGVRTAGTGGIANTYCELHAQIISRTGAASPFDEAPDPRPPGRGM